MKDSQHATPIRVPKLKYIKVNNERFSTGETPTEPPR